MTRFIYAPKEIRACLERIIRSITAMANVRLWIYNRPDLFA